MTLRRVGASRFLGKRVRGASYVHVTALPLLPDKDRKNVLKAARMAGNVTWNVAKVDDGLVSLLLYQNFDEAAFPALLCSVKVHLGSGRIAVTNWTSGDNPPILHRKELLLPPDDPRRERYARLTTELEARGLFRDARAIGRRRAWQERLADAGLRVDNHEVVEIP